jgi:hypothetical protein
MQVRGSVLLVVWFHGLCEVLEHRPAMCVIGSGVSCLLCFVGMRNDTVLLRQLGVPGQPQTAGQAFVSLYHNTAGSIAHAGER